MDDMKRVLANNMIDAYRDGYRDGFAAGRSGWTPVEMELPKPEQPVIAAFDDGAVEGIGWQNWQKPEEDYDPFLYFYDYDVETESYKAHVVTHWMPMPAHPGEGKE